MATGLWLERSRGFKAEGSHVDAPSCVKMVFMEHCKSLEISTLCTSSHSSSRGGPTRHPAMAAALPGMTVKQKGQIITETKVSLMATGEVLGRSSIELWTEPRGSLLEKVPLARDERSGDLLQTKGVGRALP